MHVLIAILTVIAAWLWGDWRNWLRYYPTMQFMALGNLTYNFICSNNFLWRFIPDSFSNYTIMELTYTFIVFPASALLFLSNYPDGTFHKKAIYYIKWILAYITVEYFFLIKNGIIYQHGWNIWWSIAFLIIMFILIRLHHTKPLLGYLCAAILGFFITFYFDLPARSLLN
ncbi:MAG: CBO0543 family protein [Syntrophomonadaceae bacterium]|nr:CBO0543 family protein [Syntrophomonadaceae bacterium]